MNYLKICLTSKRADCFGRARRKEFWHYNLLLALYIVIYAVIGTAAVYFLTGSAPVQQDSESMLNIKDVPNAVYYLILCYISLMTVVPGVSVSVRRLHDIGKSAWWILLGLIPVVGSICLLVFYLTPGQTGANKYGDDPKVYPEPGGKYRTDFQCFNTCLTKYADFKGTCNMQEFWSFTLICGELGAMAGMIGTLLDVIMKNTNNICVEVVVGLLLLALIMPGLSSSARRLRSAGYSPWILLLELIPIIGWIWIAILCLMPDKDINEGLI